MKNQGANIRHTGTGEGGGLLGRCPIVLKDTNITTADVANGSTLTVLAKDPSEVDWLRRETRDRQEDLEAAASPAGAGKQRTGPERGSREATTTVKSTKYGVSVIVTATAEVASKAIRERAAHLVEVAKTPDDSGTTATHTGEGGVECVGRQRCPAHRSDTSIAGERHVLRSQIELSRRRQSPRYPLQLESLELGGEVPASGRERSGYPQHEWVSSLRRLSSGNSGLQSTGFRLQSETNEKSGLRSVAAGKSRRARNRIPAESRCLRVRL